MSARLGVFWAVLTGKRWHAGRDLLKFQQSTSRMPPVFRTAYFSDFKIGYDLLYVYIKYQCLKSGWNSVKRRCVEDLSRFRVESRQIFDAVPLYATERNFSRVCGSECNTFDPGALPWHAPHDPHPSPKRNARHRNSAPFAAEFRWHAFPLGLLRKIFKRGLRFPPPFEVEISVWSKE